MTDEQEILKLALELAEWKARAEKLEAALREIAKVATVAWNPELPDKNEWRDIAVERIDIARAALKEQGQ